jgi:hypothetical protein
MAEVPAEAAQKASASAAFRAQGVGAKALKRYVNASSVSRKLNQLNQLAKETEASQEVTYAHAKFTKKIYKVHKCPSDNK